MLPDEAQALMAKMLLIFFGTILLCMAKVNATEFSVKVKQNNQVKSL